MRPFERADRNFLTGFANSAICLFEGRPFFSSFLCCKAAPSISLRSFFYLETNDLLIRFSNATSAAHIPGSSCSKHSF